LKLKFRGPNQKEKWLAIKTALNGRRHQNIKSAIS
jgi:hypothetical protein